jgi:hypothetical protein
MEIKIQHTMYMDVTFKGTPEECFTIYKWYDQYKTGKTNDKIIKAVVNMIQDMPYERALEMCQNLHLDKDYDLETMSTDELKEILIDKISNN